MTQATQIETTQVYRVFIKASAEAIWDAITKPDWTERYGYGGRSSYDLRPGGSFQSIASADQQKGGMPEVLLTGEVVEVDPPHRLVQTWKAGWEQEPATRLTYEIKETGKGVCSLTVVHELADAPSTAVMVGGRVENAGGGWAEVLSDIKSLLETGQSMYGPPTGA